MVNSCKECGCTCKNCVINDHDVHLHAEIECLKQRLIEQDNHILLMETSFLTESDDVPTSKVKKLKEEMLILQDKYERLYEAHKRIQRVNQGLEDKLLRLVDVCETDKGNLTKDVATLSQQLAEANYTVKKLTDSNERYKNDVNLAIQFLQCKQSNFVAHKFDSLPSEVQSQVSTYMTHKRKPEERKLVEPKSIKVPIPTFPPTAMVYSVPKSPNVDRKYEKDESSSVDIVSAAIMAKVLEERQRERDCIKHCDTCTCSKTTKIIHENNNTLGTQTEDNSSQLCWKCYDHIQTSHQGMRLSRNLDIANNKVPNFSSDTESCNNIVKVQPNNFLVENNSSSTFSLIDLGTNVQSDIPNAVRENSQVLELNNLKALQDVTFFNVNEKSQTYLPPKRNFASKLSHKNESMIHTKTFSVQKKTDIKNVKPLESLLRHKFNSNVSRNILLPDTKSGETGNEIERQTKDSEQQSLIDFKLPVEIDSEIPLEIHPENNQSCIKEWVQKSDKKDNYPRNEIKSEPNINKEKYIKMEENVKKFLFKEKELWKSEMECVEDKNCSSATNKRRSHTQTKI